MRFERALAIGKPSIVLAAAHELPQPVQLRDVLRILLVLAGGDPERFPTAAARFGARLVKEHRLSVTEAQLAFAALATLVTPEPVAGAEALSALLERHDQREASRYLEQWLRTRSDQRGFATGRARRVHTSGWLVRGPVRKGDRKAQLCPESLPRLMNGRTTERSARPDDPGGRRARGRRAARPGAATARDRCGRPHAG